MGTVDEIGGGTILTHSGDRPFAIGKAQGRQGVVLIGSVLPHDASANVSLSSEAPQLECRRQRSSQMWVRRRQEGSSGSN